MRWGDNPITDGGYGQKGKPKFADGVASIFGQTRTRKTATRMMRPTACPRLQMCEICSKTQLNIIQVIGKTPQKVRFQADFAENRCRYKYCSYMQYRAPRAVGLLRMTAKVTCTGKHAQDGLQRPSGRRQACPCIPEAPIARNARKTRILKNCEIGQILRENTLNNPEFSVISHIGNLTKHH